MPTTYTQADADTIARVKARKEDFYPDLHDSEVSVDVMLAHGMRKEGEIVTPALKAGGFPVMAAVRILGLKDRAAGRSDCELTLDADHWVNMGPARQDALIDQQLHRLALIWEDEERRVPKADDQGRPRLRIRKFDFMIGGFHEVAKRHKGDAPEVRAVRDALGGIDVVQLYLPGMDAAA